MATSEQPFDPRWAEVARLLRKFRGPLAVDALARQQTTQPRVPPFSKSSLRRYENGAAIKIDHARRLDLLYQADGEVEAAILRVLGRSKDRSVLAVPSDAIHKTSLTWTDDYDGDVWIRLSGQNTEVQRIWLAWGAWRVVVEVDLSHHPTLVTGHSAEPSGPSGPTPLIVSALVKFEVEHGTGSPPAGSEPTDVRGRWHAAES